MLFGTLYPVSTPASPLLEEKCNIVGVALYSNRIYPFRFHWARFGTGLPSDDNPVESFEIELPNIFEQGLYRKETDTGVYLLQVLDSCYTVGSILDGNTNPRIWWN
ncbi:hypothetical protein JCM17961_47880 [Endothiovibrio diazotrophicus]